MSIKGKWGSISFRSLRCLTWFFFLQGLYVPTGSQLHLGSVTSVWRLDNEIHPCELFEARMKTIRQYCNALGPDYTRVVNDSHENARQTAGQYE